MYQVICPTDFSEVSKGALQYAISLLNDLGGHLQVTHFYQIPPATSHNKMMDDMVKDGAEEEMQILLNDNTPRLGSGQTMDQLVKRGDCADQLCFLTKDGHVDLIVMGSNSSIHKMNLIFGSTAKSVINRVKVPVIVVPPGGDYRPYQKIVLACEDLIQAEVLEFVSSLGRNSLHHLYFLHVGEISFEKEIIDYYNRYLKDFSYSLHNIEGDDVLTGVNLFVQEVGADLLVMIKRKKNYLQRLFAVSHTDLELFQAEIPLLIMHGE
ncbi:MAG: universal stress protein [Saprospiraceae bacterium]|nr:universal stress protein [Saprospiraceae bacterium]